MIGDGEEDDVRFDWRRGGAAAAGLAAALVLVAMVILVKFANDARERALDAERHSYEVALIVRNVQQLYAQRSEEFSLAARAALAKQGDVGIRYFYQAAQSGTGQTLDTELEFIIRAERQSLLDRIAQSQFFSDQADQ